jgi:hypothetical protein
MAPGGQPFATRRAVGASCGAALRPVPVAHDPAQVAQEGGALQGALHQHAAAVHRVHLAAGKVELAQPVERAGDGRLRDVQFGGEAAHRMGAILQIAGEKHAELSGGQVRPVAAHEGHDGITKNTDQLIGGGKVGHGNSSFL